MDALLRADVVLLSGLSCFCAAVVVEDPSSTMMVVVAEVIAAGLSFFFCSVATTDAVVDAAFANLLSTKRESVLPTPFLFLFSILFMQCLRLQSLLQLAFRRYAPFL